MFLPGRYFYMDSLSSETSPSTSHTEVMPSRLRLSESFRFVQSRHVQTQDKVSRFISDGPPQSYLLSELKDIYNPG